MYLGSSSGVGLILLALGILGVILSFLVPDRKKANLSLILALVIVAFGVIQWGKDSWSQFRWKRRMNQMRQDRQVDIEDLRKKLGTQSENTKAELDKNKPK